MKKLFFMLVIFTLSLSAVYAQDEAAQTTAGEVATPQTDAGTNENQGAEILNSLTPYAPTFNVLRGLKSDNIDKDFEQLASIINSLENDYMFRVEYKVNEIVAEYTNKNFMDTNSYTFNNTSFYKIISGPLASDNNVALALAVVNNGFTLYNSLELFAPLVGKTNELKRMSYELNLYAGLFQMYAGNLKLSDKYLTFITDNDLTEDKAELLIVNSYIAGINNILAENQSAIFFKMYYYNKVFDSLWDIVTLETEDEAQREIKYNLLINEYSSMIYTDTARFKNTYSQYFDKLGIIYADTEKEVLSKPVREVYKNDSTAAETTEATTTDNNAAAAEEQVAN